MDWDRKDIVMSKKVVVVRYEISSLMVEPKKEKVYIIDEPVEEMRDKNGDLLLMKQLIALERKIKRDGSIRYELELVDENELTIENFNRKLNDKEIIHKVSSFESFLVLYAEKIRSMSNHNYIRIFNRSDVVSLISELNSAIENGKKRY